MAGKRLRGSASATKDTRKLSKPQGSRCPLTRRPGLRSSSAQRFNIVTKGHISLHASAGLCPDSTYQDTDKYALDILSRHGIKWNTAAILREIRNKLEPGISDKSLLAAIVYKGVLLESVLIAFCDTSQ